LAFCYVGINCQNKHSSGTRWKWLFCDFPYILHGLQDSYCWNAQLLKCRQLLDTYTSLLLKHCVTSITTKRSKPVTIVKSKIKLHCFYNACAVCNYCIIGVVFLPESEKGHWTTGYEFYSLDITILLT